MKQRLREIMDAFHHYNSPDMALQAFGLSADIDYDALVIAPSYTPMKILQNTDCRITVLREGAYIGGYLVEKNGLKIAWIKTASSASNVIDHMAVCAELRFSKMIFIGAVGALTNQFALGDICTPTRSVMGGCALTYLKDSLRDFTPFEVVEPDMEFVSEMMERVKAEGCELKPASVFCTDSIACEYFHLDEICAFGTDLIEMETAAFYRMAELMEIPAIALLVVSDNSATGVALVGRSETEEARYNRARRELLPRMIFAIAKEA